MDRDIKFTYTNFLGDLYVDATTFYGPKDYANSRFLGFFVAVHFYNCIVFFIIILNVPKRNRFVREYK